MTVYRYTEFGAAVVALHGRTCWGRQVVRRLLDAGQVLPASYERCDGPLDAHHVVPKRVIARELPRGVWYDPAKGQWERSEGMADTPPRARTLGALLNDPRNGVPVCRRHHDLIEARALLPRRRDLPAQVETFAVETGLDWLLDRAYGRPE